MQPTIAVDEYRDPDLDSSGSEAEQHTSNPSGKIRRRLHGSCDRCRKRKVKCDSAIMPDKVCTNCIQAKTECTHAIPKRKKDRQQEQINQLEERVRELEEQLKLAQEGNSGSSHKDPEALAKEEADDFAYVALAEQMHSLDIRRLENKFFGKSSMFFLASQASKVREAFRQETDAPFKKVKRPEYWNISPWQHDYAYSESTAYMFPEPDLMNLLLSAYWARVHIIYPLLHRPSFERDLQRGRHLTDEAFGRVVLLVLGCASRYVEDERVLLADESGYVGPSAGWCFVSQTPLYLRTTIIKGTDVIDLQFYALTALYYLGSSCPQTTYHIVSLALGFVVEHGMHRKSPSPPNAKDELEKRVFWVLVTMDRFMSVWLGRPVTLREGDFDADLPLDCDDEYWDTEVSDPSLAFVQPARIPSLMTGFRLHVQLGEIADKMLNTLYSHRPANASDDVSEDQWTEETVLHLDTLMNRWRDSLPQHLRWDPYTPNIHHLNQSTSLHATFYYVRIQIHRPLLSLKTPTALSSLATCSHAARACSNVVSDSMKRQRYSAPLLHNAVLVAAFVLSIGLCGRRGSKVPYETGRELQDIEKCLIFLREGERRWYTAGRAVDMILELVNLGDGRESFSNTKRPREWVPHDFSDRRPPAPDGGSFGRRPSGQGLGISTGFGSSVIPSIATGVHRRPSQIGAHATSPMLMGPPPRISTTGPYDVYQPQPQHPVNLQLQDQQNSCMVQPDPGTIAALVGLGFDDSVTSWNSAPLNYDVEQWERYLAELNANPFGSHDPRSVIS